MIINKVAAIVTAGTMVFSMSGLAFAYTGNSHFTLPSNDISVTNEHTQVLNVAGSVANTGLVSQSGGWASRQTLYTGSVSTISSNAQSDVNTTILPACSSCSRGDISVRNRNTEVANIAVSLASTGLNRQSGSLWSSQTMGTGTVDHVSSNATTLVNYTEFSVN